MVRAWPAVAFALAVLAATPSGAHSLQQFESALREREIYFDPQQRPAPEFALAGADGRRVALADLRGKVVVLHFVYASCPDVCPLHAERIAEVQAMVNRTPMREQVAFITITTDPVRDTPEVMREYGPAHGLDPVNWTFLTSGAERPDATRDLAKSFGHVFSPAPDGMQVHGVVTHVIDREGNLRANFHGLKFAPVNLVTYVNALVNDVHGDGTVERPSIWQRLGDLF